ncbi:hypothetical protein [Prevotella sp. HCN-7019]|uniref:hypothetical protein n=1 Tax=Prevotella sp. HCN-7019 TaxID=3134668 RepID=UPI0030C040F9
MKIKCLLLLLSTTLIFACGNSKPSAEQKDKAERYIQRLMDAKINIHDGELTDANFLILAVDAYPGANFDTYAETYLDDALRAGLNIKGVYIVDVKDCQIGDGWVTGKRIGRAYKN